MGYVEILIFLVGIIMILIGSFNKKLKKPIKIVLIVVGILIVIAVIFLFGALLILLNGIE